jgi:hypothetical protein
MLLLLRQLLLSSVINAVALLQWCAPQQAPACCWQVLLSLLLLLHLLAQTVCSLKSHC